MKRRLFSLFVLSLSLFLVACGGDGGESGNRVGVSMPTKSLQRWNQDGSNMKSMLEEKGYEVDLEYAENDISTQVSQIENMITKGVKVLVVAAVDGGSLSTVLDDAKEDGIFVIAYDRLLLNTEAVDYYATFDNSKVGSIQGQYIVDSLELETGSGPFNLEIGTGPLNDTTANFFFDGAMDVLEKYIDSNQLIIKSGQGNRAQHATDNWDEQIAQTRLDNVITAHYTDDKIDAILASNDSISLGFQSSLKSVGYGTDDLPMPIITGQDANISNVKAILAGDQSMSVFKDTRALAEKVSEMVDGLIKGEKVEVNDTTSYDNGVKIVDSYLIQPEFVDITNYIELLIETGYYTEDDLK